MKMSTLKLSNLRKLCKDPKDLGRVTDFLEVNPEMDLIGEGHGGSIRAAIKANNPAALTALLKYHRAQKIDIHEVGSEEYYQALDEFKKVLDEILDENWNFIEQRYIFSEEVKNILKPYIPLSGEEEQDLGSDEDEEYIISPSNPDSFKMLQAKIPQPTLDLSAAIEAIIAGCSTDSSHSDQKSSDEDDIPPPDFCSWPDSLAHRHLSGDNGDGLSPVY